MKKPLYFQYQRKSQRFDRNKKKKENYIRNVYRIYFPWIFLLQKTIYFSTSRKTQTLASGIKHQLRRRATEEKISEVVVFPPGNTARRKTLKTRKLRKEIAKITHPGVDGGASVIWRDSILTIPPVPPSFLEGCKIIDIRYFLKVYLYAFRWLACLIAILCFEFFFMGGVKKRICLERGEIFYVWI